MMSGMPFGSCHSARPAGCTRVRCYTSHLRVQLGVAKCVERDPFKLQQTMCLIATVRYLAALQHASRGAEGRGQGGGLGQ